MAPRRTSRPTLTVTFHKVDGHKVDGHKVDGHKVDGRSPRAWWEAVKTTRGRVIGGHMPIGRGRIPHDMAHMATEALLEIDHGFWGLLARGATFDHGTQQRRTEPGRRIIRENRAALGAAESLGNEHHFAWAQGRPTPVAPAFDRLATLWEEIADGATLTVQWPSLDIVEP